MGELANMQGEAHTSRKRGNRDQMSENASALKKKPDEGYRMAQGKGDFVHPPRRH